MESGDTLDDALTVARSGDESGFLVLWADLQPRLLRYLQVLGCDDVEDVASETWFQAVRDLDGFNGSADEFRGWLFTIGRHRAVDAARSRTRFRDKILVPAMAAAASLAAVTERYDASPVEDEAIYGLSVARAVDLVRGLNKDQAEVVALRVIAGLDTDTVARILGKSAGAVRVALHRGLKTLAKDPRIRAFEKVDQ
jgi:RNA polymerase sigma-70 factor, ECF subfamily